MRQRVTYKVALLTHMLRTTAIPMYLSELVQIHAPPRALRSSDAPLLVVPCIHTELLHPPVTIYLLTLDCPKIFSLSNTTWKPIIYCYSDTADNDVDIDEVDGKQDYVEIVNDNININGQKWPAFIMGILVKLVKYSIYKPRLAISW